MCVNTHNKDNTKVRKKQTQYTTVLDWLEVTVKQKKGTHFHEYDENNNLKDVIPFANNIHLERQKNRSGHSYKMTKSYGAVYTVFYNNSEVAELQTYSRYGKHDHSQIKLLNYLLYTDSWRDVLTTLLEALQADINNFTRIDIAIDGKGFIAQHLAYRDQVRNGKLKKVGRAKTSIIENGQYNCEGFNVGTRKSGKLLTGYGKGMLIQDAKIKGRDHKPYIVDFWHDNGLIKDKSKIEHIERLEMKLTAQRLKEVKDLTMDKLLDSDYLAGLFEMECDNFYQWTKVTKDTNTTRAKAKAIVHAVNWQLLKAKQVVRQKVRKVKNALWGARMTISQMMREYYVNTKFAFWESCEQAQAQLQYCRLMAERYGISDWFNLKLTTWENDREQQQAIIEAIQLAQVRTGIRA